MEGKWRKSSYSGPQDNCVEIAAIDYLVGVRDSKNPSGGALTMPPASWENFLDSLKAGRIQ